MAPYRRTVNWFESLCQAPGHTSHGEIRLLLDYSVGKQFGIQEFLRETKTHWTNFIDWYSNYVWPKEVVVLMLLTMDLDIQRNLAHLGAYDMLHELKAMFSKQAEQELLQTVREFHTCKQEEGQSVSSQF
ncbi:hypothetical protein Tco_0475717 [Tanacetum coccineum]